MAAKTDKIRAIIRNRQKFVEKHKEESTIKPSEKKQSSQPKTTKQSESGYSSPKEEKVDRVRSIIRNRQKFQSNLNKSPSVAPATEEKSPSKNTFGSTTLPNGINRATAASIMNSMSGKSQIQTMHDIMSDFNNNLPFTTERITHNQLNRVFEYAPQIYPDLVNVQNEIATSKKELEQLRYDLDNKYTDEYWNSVYESEYERLSKELENAPTTTSTFDAFDGKGVPKINPGVDAVANTVAQKNAVEARERELKKSIADLESMEKLYKYSAVTHAPDFEEYAKKGAEIEGYAFSNETADIASKTLLNNETEAKIFNYLLAKYGETEAHEYADGLQLVLTQRQGKNDAEWLDNINKPIIEELATATYGIGAGIENWIVGTGELFSNEPHRTTSKEVASQYILEDLADDGIKIGDTTSAQLLYQGANTVGNMLPSIAISYMTSGVASGLGASASTASKVGSISGNVAMGMSTTGSAKAQALAEGYDADQAWGYGILVGASEATLQELLGGVSALGGVNETRLMAKLQAVDNAFLRVAGTSAYKALGEVTEEEIQLFLEPYFRTVVFNEEYDAPEVGEMIETALVTFLSTGALESGSTISTAKGNGKYGKEIISGNYTDDVITQGLASPLGSVERGIAQSLSTAKESGKDVSAHKLGTLAEMIGYEIPSDEQTATAEESPTTLEEAAMARANDRDTHWADDMTSLMKNPEETAKEKPTMRNVLRDEPISLGVFDGQTFVTNTDTILPAHSSGKIFLPVNDAEMAKTELGATEDAKVGLFAGKLLSNSDYTPIKGKGVDGTLPKVGDVRVFTDDEGREVALPQDVAEYFDGYNLEATFRGGKPYAVKATDSNGNVAGIAMAVWNNKSGESYNVTEAKPMTAQETAEQTRQKREAGIRKLTGFGDYGVKAFTDIVEGLPAGDISMASKNFNTAYRLGMLDTPMNKMNFTNELQRIAFNAGKQDYIMSQNKAEENVKKVLSYGDKAGLDRTNAPSHVTSDEMDVMDIVSRELGVQTSFIGNSDMFNANMTPNKATVYIANDFNRTIGYGENAREVSVLYHFLHEAAGHRAKELAPKAYSAFEREMYKYLEMTEGEGLADEKRQKYASRKVDLTVEGAIEEIGADSIFSLYDYDVNKFKEGLNRVFNGKNKQAIEGANKFKQALDYIISKLKELLEKLGLKQKKVVETEIAEIKKLRDMLENALSVAVKKNAEIASKTTTDKNGVITNSDGDVVAQLNEDGTANFSLKTFDDSGRAELKKWLDKNVKNKKLTQDEANEIADQLEYYYDICKGYEDKYAPFSAWSKAEVVKGLDGKPLMSVVKTNGEYKLNLDFSLVCKKRRPLDALYRAMIDDGFMDNISQLSEVEVATINQIIRKHGFETACTLCFVDSKRYRAYAVADSFVSKYNELVKMLAPEGTKIDRFDFSGKRAASAEGLHTMSDAELKSGINKLNKVIKEHGETTIVGKIAKHLKAHPKDRMLVSVSDFMDSEGFKRVSQSNPNVLKLYNMSKGSGGPKATLPDVQYLGEILKKQNFTQKKAYSVGGVRVQSFSDYIPRLVFDYLQMTADLTAKKLPAHAYSKEDIFVMQFGKTGIKINMSLVPAVAEGGIAPGLDKDGNYVWVDGHTFASDFHDKGSGQRGFELAIKIQNTEGYAQNCGTVAVGVSDEHIEKMLKDNNIRMVIPYHKSSLNHFVAKMGNIDQYKDYTSVQNTRYRSGENAGKKITGKDFNFNEAFHRLGDAKAATKEYLAWCDKNDYLPKFDHFAFNEDAEVRENYYKVLIDFAAYDSEGNATPQGAVTMNFPTESDAFGSMKSLIEKGLEADAILEGRKEKQIPEILKEVKEVIGGQKFSLKDSEGNTLSNEQRGYFKASKVRDENGNLKVVYHGTSKGGFTWFDTYAYYSKFGLFGNGAYFTENKDIAESYTKKGRGNNPQVYSVYLNISNPIDMDAKADIDAWNEAIRKSGEDIDLLQGEKTNEQAFKSIVEDLEYLEVYSYDAAEIVRNLFESMGYDGITHIGGGRVKSDGVKHRVWIAFEPEQIKDIDNKNPTTNIDINYSLKGAENNFKSYSELIEEYGAIPKGEKPFRDIQVPQKTAEDKKVSQTVRTILEAKATPDELVPNIEKMVEDGVFSYEVYGDKKAIANAERYIEEYGWDDSLDDWFDAINKGEVSKDMTTVGWMLYNNAANTAADATTQEEKQRATRDALKILDAMVRHQRSAAQALQATRILKKMSPETQLYGVQKSVQSLQKELEEKYGDKAPDLKIDEALAEEFLKAKTPEERAEVEKKIYKDIGRQMPSRFVDKWNAWRYLAMLGNVKTHGRNVLGNALFAPFVNIKNVFATGIEVAVHKVSGGKTARSKALLNPKSKVDRELIKAAYEDYANVADEISNGGKYSDFAMANQAIEDGRKIFKNKLLEGARKGNSWLLEKEDLMFAKPHYAYALAMYGKANKITAEQLKKGKALGNARQYAIKEAQKATYRDTNAFSQFVSNLGRVDTKKNVVTKGASMALEGILPFRKTPANILVRGLEYSPLGLLRGIKQAVWDVQRGKKTSAEAIDSISAGLTGTGLMLLGMLLSNLGVIRGHGEDEEKEKEFKEMMGHQAYSLELPNGTSVTLDWLAPEALPFFVGVNLVEKMRAENEEMNMSTIIETVGGITEPMLEMSCLQGVNDLVEGVGYASSNDTSGLVSVASSAVTSYLLQALPTLGGQIERTTEEHRMTTYTDKNDFLTGDMQYFLGKASAKLPIPYVDYHQIPYIDAWGRKETSGAALKRGFDNFLNPAYTSTINTSAMEEELLRLYEQTGEGAVFPARADKYFTIDGERKDLAAEEYVRYATLKGEKSYKLVSDLMKNKSFKSLSDAEKVEAISNAYDYANQKAKQAVANYKPENWVTTADKFGANVGNYISFKTEVESTAKANDDKISKHQVVDIVLDTAQNDTEAWDMYLSRYDSKGAKYAREEGVSGETYLTYLDYLGDISDEKSVKKSEAVDAIQKLNLDSDDSWAIYLSEFDDSGAKMAKQYGVKGDKYIDYRDYLDKVDEYYAKKKRAEEGNPDDELKLGSYTQDEVAVALDMVKGLSQRDKAIIWQSMNKSWKTKNNPFL